MHRLISFVLRRLADESGVTLLIAVMTVTVLGISTAAVVEYSSSNERSSHRSLERQDALAVAEEGLNVALAVIDNANKTVVDTNGNNYVDSSEMEDTVVDQDLLPDSGSSTARNCTGGGAQAPLVYTNTVAAGVVDSTATVCGHVVTTTGLGGAIDSATWYIVSVGQTSGSGSNSSRVVTAEIPIIGDIDLEWSDAFKYTYSSGRPDSDGTYCDQTILNNTTVTSRMYVYGDLCLGNSAAIDGISGATTQLIVRGRIRADKNSGGVIGVTTPVTEILVGNGCRRANGATSYAPPNPDNPGGSGWELPCTWAGSGVRAEPSGTVTSSNDIPPPTTSYSYWYTHANLRPDNMCSGANLSGTPPTFDNDTTLNNSAGTLTKTQLFPSTAYTCRVLDVNDEDDDGDTTEIIGQMDWNPSTSKWTVNGVIYIDGSVYLDSVGPIDMDGFASIYVTGSLELRQAKICMVVSGSTCSNTTWNTTTLPIDMLLWCVKGDGTAVEHVEGGFDLDVWARIGQSSYFQGAIYSEKAIEIQNQSTQEGPVVSQSYVIQNKSTVDYFPDIVSMPDGTPGEVTLIQYDFNQNTIKYGL